MEAAGARVTVTRWFIGDATATLELASPVSPGDRVDVSYTQPSGLKLQDPSGNPVEDFELEATNETRSQDAALSGLAVADGSSSLKFDHPVFASDTTRYYLSVANTVSTLTVRPTTNHDGATVAYFDDNGLVIADRSAASGLQASLAEGRNVIEVEVTAEDGTTTETYAIEVGRAASAPATCDVLWCANLTLGYNGLVAPRDSRDMATVVSGSIQKR